MQHTLTEGQQSALDAFIQFLMDASKSVLVLKGYSGTGKSTLVKRLLEEVPRIYKTVSLINPSHKNREVVLTATTNKAAEALRALSGQDVSTIHSHLGLTVRTDYQSGKTSITTRRGAEPREFQLIFIDEASFIDQELLDYIIKLPKHCKLVFIGDPAQLTPVGYNFCPVFEAGYETACLSEVVRHDGPILELATKFRNTVETGQFFKFTPDGHAVQWMNRSDFEDEIVKEFCRPDWKHNDSKVLAWTNKTVVFYNRTIAEHVTGTPEFQVGDYAICNYFVNCEGGISFKTDQTVQLTGFDGSLTTLHDIEGRWVWVEGRARLFLPKVVTDKKARIERAREEGDFNLASEIEKTWIDLRPAYSSTINKSQGSTYRRVFIDLDDLKKCPDGILLARLLYVGVSRASQQVILTGDLV